MNDVDATSSESELEMEEVEVIQTPTATFVAPLSPPTKQERQSISSQLHLEVESLAEMLKIDQREIDRKFEVLEMLSDGSLWISHFRIV